VHSLLLYTRNIGAGVSTGTPFHQALPKTPPIVFGFSSMELEIILWGLDFLDLATKFFII